MPRPETKTGPCAAKMTSTSSSVLGRPSARRRSTPKILLVRRLVSRIWSRRVSASIMAPARTPRPPALETAAVSSARATPPMPAWMIGYSMPSISVNAVLNILFLSEDAAPAAGRPAPSLFL